MIASGEAVRLEREEGIVTMTLNRPEVLNAYNRAMRDQIFEALTFVASVSEIKVLLVRGAGRAFGSGGDLSEFGLAASPLAARETRNHRDVWGLWSTLPCVTIASVHGLAVGGGFEMALLCDLLIAADSARFRLPETALGTLPGVGGTQTLPRALGAERAAGVVLAGEEISGLEAGRLGLAQWVCSAKALPGRSRTLAQSIAAISEPSLAAAREALRRGADLPLAEGLRLEARLAKRLRKTKT